TELAKLTGLISQLRAEQSAHKSKSEALRLAGSKNENRIAELDDEISGIAVRREITEENRRNIDKAISDADAARNRVQKEIAVARMAMGTARTNVDYLKSKAQDREEKLREPKKHMG